MKNIHPVRKSDSQGGDLLLLDPVWGTLLIAKKTQTKVQINASKYYSIETFDTSVPPTCWQKPGLMLASPALATKVLENTEIRFMYTGMFENIPRRSLVPQSRFKTVKKNGSKLNLLTDEPSVRQSS